MKVKNCYISTNCNQVPTVVDWGKNNLICYGAKNSVIIWDPKIGSGGVATNSLVGHSKRVNSVKWLSGKDTDHERELVSGAADGTVCVWTLDEIGYKFFQLKGHESNVNIVDGLYKKSLKTEAVVVSVSMDCTVNIWLRHLPNDDFHKTQTIDLGYNLAVGTCLYLLPTDELLLGCCLDNSKINIYVEQNDISATFQNALILAGHDEWVRGIDFTTDGNDILIASSSQDAFIRIWRLTSEKKLREGPIETNNDLKLTTNKVEYYVYLDSVLTGHESWVYSVRWSPTQLKLLSASLDKTLIIWKYCVDSQMWLEDLRFGEVGGNTLGFYGGIFSPKGTEILGHSYNGAFHVWRESENSDQWRPCVTIGGHFSEVVDCAWEPKGQFLISAGTDQTVRIHAQWSDCGKEATWHEIARPQVHGYDMSSIAVMSRYGFASAAEEKIIRVFTAPVNFVENFRNLCMIKEDGEGDTILNNDKDANPKGACVPSLGLSNKAVYSSTNQDEVPVNSKNSYPEESHFSETHMTEPPTEETLLQNTLWPEAHKLYGHGYEVYSLDASSDGKYLASACKSTKPEYAAILLWDTATWTQIQKLMSHTLTVVQLRFSPDSNHLLSVSRDRRWSLFSKTDENNFELTATTDKKTAVHSRIIWTCSWTHDSTYFATGSRDGKVVVWAKNMESSPSVLERYKAACDPIEFNNESVTAVSFGPILIQKKYIMAVGLDSGLIYLYSWNIDGWKELSFLSNSEAHHLTVRRLAFRPVFETDESKDNTVSVQLASCSSDNSVKIYNILLDK